MPTARELLEQADALMRRNRLAAAPAADDGIPMLTEAVQPPGAHAAVPPQAPAPARAPVTELDDVPLLTDAVEEIEAPSILEEPPDIEEPPELDDPAAWTDTLTGAHSILGEDRLELPPPVPASELTSSARVPDRSPFPSGVVERSAEWDAAVAPYQSTPAAGASDAPSPVVPLEEIGAERIVGASPPAMTPVPATTFDDRDFDALPRDDAAEPARVHVYDAPGRSTPPHESSGQATVIAATPFEFAPGGDAGAREAPEPATADTMPPVADPLFERYDMGAEATLPGVAARPAPAPVASASAPPDDEERWSALAEEIRMQVLQRIDLFTDTGLREQLAARMQPIVDRASADLVATINQHVGVLLRAYVAEAIEREIERWRADRP